MPGKIKFTCLLTVYSYSCIRGQFSFVHSWLCSIRVQFSFVHSWLFSIRAFVALFYSCPVLIRAFVAIFYSYPVLIRAFVALFYSCPFLIRAFVAIFYSYPVLIRAFVANKKTLPGKSVTRDSRGEINIGQTKFSSARSFCSNFSRLYFYPRGGGSKLSGNFSQLPFQLTKSVHNFSFPLPNSTIQKCPVKILLKPLLLPTGCRMFA